MNKKIFHHVRNPRIKIPDNIYEGYGYCTYKTVGDVRYIRCCEHYAYSCNAHGKLVNNRPRLSKGHNHEADPQLHLYNTFQHALFEATISRPFRSFRIIYDELSVVHYEAAVNFTWAKMKPVMENWRRREQPQRPPTPQNLQEYSNLLNMPQWSHLLTYPQGQLKVVTLTSTDDSFLTILCNVDFLKSINTSMLFMDATFKITPKMPNIYQVFTVLGLIDHHQALPLCWVLMTKKSTIAYQTALSYFKTELATHITPQTIMTDFEAALDNAIKCVFPEATHTGCFFHFCQAITRRLKKLGLIRLVQNWKYGKILIRKIMALALLPAVDASDGFQWIVTNIPDNVKTLFETFLLYFHEQWIEKTPPTLWSVYGLLHRTDNLAETYHKKANLRFGAHSPIWKFTENLTALQAVTHIEYLSLRNGDNIVRPRSSRTQEMDVKIVKAWQLFNDNILDVPHFLACASNFLQSFQREITHNVVIQHDCDQQSNVFDSDDSIMKNNYDNHLVFLELDIMQNY